LIGYLKSVEKRKEKGLKMAHRRLISAQEKESVRETRDKAMAKAEADFYQDRAVALAKRQMAERLARLGICKTSQNKRNRGSNLSIFMSN